MTARTAVLVALAACLYASLVHAWADFRARRGTVADLRGAVRLLPGHPDYARRLALASGRDDDLARAAGLNPRDARIRIALALSAEAGGDFAAAERHLLAAARSDARFEPRWTLANYYFRRNDDRFWTWAASAAAVPETDLTPLYRLCWRWRPGGAGHRVSGPAERQTAQDDRLPHHPDANFIARAVVPARISAQVQYLRFLLAEAAPSDLASVAARMRPHDPVLLEVCDRLIDAGDIVSALRVWNRATGARHSEGLTDPEFRLPRLGHGFGWRLTESATVDARRDAAAPGLRIWLSGRQPETVILASQTVPLKSGRRYRVRFDCRGGEVPGLAWHIARASADCRGSNRLDFRMPRGLEAASLELRYERRPGTTRAEGTVWITGLALEPMP